ncbi:OprB family porin [Zymomonas mobilis]|uniref:OprB family porin n=1 Tax=Zymomonas mobilis TaxID=542 RepID=A0A542W2J7_ZYMMB|nr:carbohydrate porin [Zymomonas mobilis]TQL17793.1 OprB family porin [Zymomonas mobilis]
MLLWCRQNIRQIIAGGTLFFNASALYAGATEATTLSKIRYLATEKSSGHSDSTLSLTDKNISEPTPPDASAAELIPHDQHLLGDWGGALTTLKSHGVDLTVNYLGESVGNVSGGIKPGVDYADQRALGIDVDWQKLAGIKGFSTHLLLVNRVGNGVGPDYVGDNLYNESEIWGGAGHSLHLAYIYGQENLLNDKLIIAAGRLSPGLFFNSSPIYCSFFSFGICPTPQAIRGGSQGAFSMAPGNTFGGYTRYSPGYDLYVQTGVFGADSHLGGSSGFSWTTKDVTGVTVPFEFGWTPGQNPGENPMHFKAGFYYTTGSAKDVYYNTARQPMALYGGDPLKRRGYMAEWVGMDAMLIRHGKGANQGLTLFANYSHTDGNISVFQDLAFIGLEDHGLIKSRPLDSFGVQFVYSHQSAATRRSERLEQAYGIGDAYPQTYTSIIEAQYSAHIYNGVDLTPDIQYVIRPNAQSRYRNAVVLGIRTQIQL